MVYIYQKLNLYYFIYLINILFILLIPANIVIILQLLWSVSNLVCLRKELDCTNNF